MEKGSYSMENYEAAKKKAEEAKTSGEKAKAYGEMAELEGEAHEEAKEFDVRFTQARTEEEAAKAKMARIRAEMGVSPEDEDKVLIDMLREKLGFSPEKELKILNPKIGGKTKDELVQEAEEKKIEIGSYAQSLLDNEKFTTSKEAKETLLAELTGNDLGLKDGYTTKEFFDKLTEVGLFKCSAEVGPDLRLQDSGKGFKLIAMEPITDRGGIPTVFSLNSGGEQLKLDARNAGPDRGWDADDRWVVSLRPPEAGKQVLES